MTLSMAIQMAHCIRLQIMNNDFPKLRHLSHDNLHWKLGTNNTSNFRCSKEKNNGNGYISFCQFITAAVQTRIIN